MRFFRILIPPAALLLCSCSLWRAKDADVYLQPRLLESARTPPQQSAVPVPLVPSVLSGSSVPSVLSDRSDKSDKSDKSDPKTARSRLDPTGSPAPAPVAQAAPAQTQASDFTLSIKADPWLNRFRESAHALHLCVYQLKEPNGFRQLGEEREGLSRLMECSRFDPSVAHATRMVVQPGELVTETRERAEGVRYLGIATGYYGSSKRKILQLVTLPAEGGGLRGRTVSIELGSGEIERITVN